MKRDTIVRWWPHDAPIPSGWRYASHEASHHTRYGIIIEKMTWLERIRAWFEKCDETSDNVDREPRK